MKLYNNKSLSNRIYSKMAQDIGHSIRQEIISEKKCSSVKKVQPYVLFNKTKSQFNEGKSFWINPYQTQKSNWKFSQPKFTICQKQDIDQYKKYELQKFKQKLKSKLQERQQAKKYQIELNRSRVKSIRYQQHETRQEKLQYFKYNKFSQAQLFKRKLQKKKMQARILKRQKALDLQFKKWHRQEQKQQKHKKKLLERQRFRTTVN